MTIRWLVCLCIFFFKQKTAYEMRISDWSSDVCSSDLETLRKKNASVIFATQSLSDIDGSAIAPAIIESCQTRILLPNERAIEPQITAIYRRFGLNDRQIEILARAMRSEEHTSELQSLMRISYAVFFFKNTYFFFFFFFFLFSFF